MATIRFTNTGKTITRQDYMRAIEVIKSIDTLFKLGEGLNNDHLRSLREQFESHDKYKDAQETVTLYRTYRWLALDDEETAEYHVKVNGDTVEIKVVD